MPATYGVAIEVPLSVLLPPVKCALVTPTPGANMLTHSPKFENDATESFWSTAPTVKAAAALDGEYLQASSASLPAATMDGKPASLATAIAASSECDGAPPRDCDSTALFPG